MIAVLLLAGCTHEEQTQGPSSGDTDFAALAESSLRDAQAAEASAAQIEILQRVADAGAISYEDVQDAVNATFECWDRSGVKYQVLAPIVEDGIAFPQYAFEGGLDTSVADACLHENSDFVETLYWSQPTAREADARAFEAAMPVMIACLERLGVVVEPDITAAELQQVILPTEEEVTGPLRDQAFERLSCVREAGIDGF